MKICLMVVGKTDANYLNEGINEYCNRLQHYIPFELQALRDIKNTKNLSADQLKEKEGELLLKNFQLHDFIVLLDEHGKEFTSIQFAQYIEKKMHIIPKRLVFVIGGSYGFSKKIYGRANEKISLSKMTLSHQMIRLFMVEQLYRALTILNNEPYHHE